MRKGISVVLSLVAVTVGLIFLTKETNGESSHERPNIVFILADDLGFNDVSFRGSSEIMTPNIDALAFSGIILNKYYVNPICTPTRSALMTGKYPIHTGMQHTVLYGAEPRGLPLSEKILPQYLRDLGYSNHIVGKWHLGHYKKEYTPLHRGFESHTGYWTGHQDLFDHSAVEHGMWGLDMRRGMNVAYDLHGKYTTEVIKEESVKVIKAHNKTVPLFLYMAHAAVHSGNPYSPLPAPDVTVSKLGDINDYNRRKFAAMLTELDDSVGAVVSALTARGMLDNTIIIFSSDNGGPAEGFNLNAASNWPLRGVKNTLWEGGVRAAGLIFSPLIQNPSRMAGQMFQVADWLPTLYRAAGGDPADLIKDGNQIDGIDNWDELINDEPSRRTEILHNIDDIWGSAALTVGDWKVLKGTNYNGDWDGWYGPAGNRSASAYNFKNLIDSVAGTILLSRKKLPSPDTILRVRAAANTICNKTKTGVNCNALQSPCLYNIVDDPCEVNNVADHFPSILKTLLNRLQEFNHTAVPPANLPDDPRGNPALSNYVWTNFGDSPTEFRIEM